MSRGLLLSITPNLTSRCASMNLEGVQPEVIKKQYFPLVFMKLSPQLS